MPCSLLFRAPMKALPYLFFWLGILPYSLTNAWPRNGTGGKRYQNPTSEKDSSPWPTDVVGLPTSVEGPIASLVQSVWDYPNEVNAEGARPSRKKETQLLSGQNSRLRPNIKASSESSTKLLDNMMPSDLFREFSSWSMSSAFLLLVHCIGRYWEFEDSETFWALASLALAGAMYPARCQNLTRMIDHAIMGAAVSSNIQHYLSTLADLRVSILGINVTLLLWYLLHHMFVILK